MNETQERKKRRIFWLVFVLLSMFCCCWYVLYLNLNFIYLTNQIRLVINLKILSQYIVFFYVDVYICYLNVKWNVEKNVCNKQMNIYVCIWCRNKNLRIIIIIIIIMLMKCETKQDNQTNEKQQNEKKKNQKNGWIWQWANFFSSSLRDKFSEILKC